MPIFDEVFNNFWRRIAHIDEVDDPNSDDEMTSQGEEAATFRRAARASSRFG